MAAVAGIKNCLAGPTSQADRLAARLGRYRGDRERVGLRAAIGDGEILAAALGGVADFRQIDAEVARCLAGARFPHDTGGVSAGDRVEGSGSWPIVAAALTIGCLDDVERSVGRRRAPSECDRGPPGFCPQPGRRRDELRRQAAELEPGVFRPAAQIGVHLEEFGGERRRVRPVPCQQIRRPIGPFDPEVAPDRVGREQLAVRQDIEQIHIAGHQEVIDSGVLQELLRPLGRPADNLIEPRRQLERRDAFDPTAGRHAV